VRFKVARRGGVELNASPEFDDCARLAAQHGVAVKTVHAAAVAARARASAGRAPVGAERADGAGEC
jgi:uncharacterized protein (DUF111 family)